jgi:ribosome-associated toxin RatA of RatAB toxin-antitoxin module
LVWTLDKGVFTINQSSEIEAPISLVYDVVADVAKYPEFINDVPNATVDGDIAIMTLRVGPMKIPLKTRIEAEPLKFTRWTMIDGPMKSLVGQWSFEGNDERTTISLEAKVEAGALGSWMMRMVGKMADRQIQKLDAAYRERIKAIQAKQTA